MKGWFDDGFRARVACTIVAGLHHFLFSMDYPRSQTPYRINRKLAFLLQSNGRSRQEHINLKNDN